MKKVLVFGLAHLLFLLSELSLTSTGTSDLPTYYLCYTCVAGKESPIFSVQYRPGMGRGFNTGTLTHHGLANQSNGSRALA